MSNFRLSYDGPALATSEMDVRELAPALLAAGDLLNAATRVINGERSKSQTNVKGSFKVGSFGVDFSLVSDWTATIRDIFSSDTVNAVANAAAILGMLGFVGKQFGLLGLLQWIRGRNITKIDTRDGVATVYINEESVEVDERVISLMLDPGVREFFDKLLAPLDKEGIDTFASGTDDTIDQMIKKEHRKWFSSCKINENLILKDNRKMAFSIVSLTFKEANKWRLSDGSAIVNATISDQDFLERVDQSLEVFAKGDSLICMVDVSQWQTSQGVRSEYEVTQVIEHRTAYRQAVLELE